MASPAESIARAPDRATTRAARLFLARVSRDYALKEALLFGSRARHEHRADSDADIAVILAGPPQPLLATKLALADMAYDVMLDTGILIQALPVWQQQWEHPDATEYPALLGSIARDGIKL